MVILSVHPSVLLSRPGTISKSVEIETLGFHHMIASLVSLVFRDKVSCHWVEGVPSTEGVKQGTPPKKTLFYCYWLV